MIITVYFIIIIYFVLGGAGFWLIARKKSKQKAAQIKTKYITYFIIIHILFLSIVLKPLFFHYICLVIIFAVSVEMGNLFRKSGFSRKGFFGMAFILFLIFCAGFYRFSLMDRGIILFTFLVVSIFDAFSQISGQLAGKKKIFPSISPEKTIEGLSGGTLVAVASSLLIRGLTGTGIIQTLMLAAGIVVFAFIGDTATSLYKRKYDVKDFSNILPGHGGFADRFDSLIAGGAFMALLELTQY